MRMYSLSVVLNAFKYKTRSLLLFIMYMLLISVEIAIKFAQEQFLSRSERGM